MSEDKDELFAAWLKTNLHTHSPISLVFAQRVVRKMERLKAQKMLRKVIGQERLAAGMLALTSALLLGLLCCPPVLKWLYSAILDTLKVLIQTFSQQTPEMLALLAGALLLMLGLLIRSAWNNLAND